MATQMSKSRASRDALQETVDDATLLEHLGDEYTRRVLAAVTENRLSGSEVMNAADVSKATAYRRLGDLEDAGLVESEMAFDPDGHHHEKFHAIVESVDITFDEDGMCLSVERDTAGEREGDRHRFR